MPKPFEHAVTVRFAEVDRAGIAYFNHIFHWCHLAYEEFLAAGLGRFDEAFGRSGWGTPVVRAESDFQRMIRHGDRLIVRMSIGRIGTKSITFAYDVMGPDGDDDRRAQVRMTHAFVDFETGKAIPMPQAFGDALLTLETVVQV